MIIIELFSGSGNMAKAFKDRGHKVLTIDNNPNLNPDLVADILDLNIKDIPPPFNKPDIIWASPPCTAFSVCVIGKNWKSKKPISENAKLGLELLYKTQNIIKELKPTYYFIENPRGMMRHFNFMGNRKTITYCQYGEKYQKPTDIWTNANIILLKPCRAKSFCHTPSPRGVKSGIQALPNAFERGKLPPKLCQAIVNFCEIGSNQKTLA